MADKPISLDMSKAATMEAIPDGTRVLLAVTGWEGKASSQGNPSLKLEVTVVAPDSPGIKNRKIFDTINLENEYTLGRFLSILKALGWSEEDARSLKALPDPDGVMGLQFAATLGVRKQEGYNDQNTLKSCSPAASYSG